MSNIIGQFDAAQGGNPPPPYMPLNYKRFWLYLGQRHSVMDAEFSTSGFSAPAPAAGGEYTCYVKGKRGGDYSQAHAVDSIIVDGPEGTPSGGNPMPDGVADVAGPSNLQLSIT